MWLNIEDVLYIAKVEKSWFQGALQHNLSFYVNCLGSRDERLGPRATLHEIAVILYST